MDRRIPPANTVIIAGQLVTDPRRRLNDNGVSCAEFLMASNRTFKTASNERREKSCFVSVVAWGVLADDCLSSLSRKSAVYVEGELESAPKSQGGKVSIRATRIEFLDRNAVRRDEHADRNRSEC